MFSPFISHFRVCEFLKSGSQRRSTSQSVLVLYMCTVSIYFMVATASTFFIVAMTFERFYSIIMPHKAASFNTVKRAKITISFLVLFSALFNFPHFLVTSHQEWLCLPFGRRGCHGDVLL